MLIVVSGAVWLVANSCVARRVGKRMSHSRTERSKWALTNRDLSTLSGGVRASAKRGSEKKKRRQKEKTHGSAPRHRPVATDTHSSVVSSVPFCAS